MKKTISHHPKNAGFNIVELLLAVGIIAIISTFAAPNILSFFELQKLQEETAVMETMQHGLAAYAEENAKLPDVATIFDDLERPTNYIARQMALNTWGSPRVYATMFINQVYRDAIFPVYYGVIISLGEDGCLTVAGDDICDVVAIAAQMLTLIDDGGDTTALFDALNAEGDDTLVKYNDFKQKAKAYEKTSKRLAEIADALAVYAKTQRYLGIQMGEADAEYKIFFPPSDDSWPAANNIADLYGDSVITDTNDATNLVDVVESSISNGADDVERLSNMLALMKLLGLPESNCCSAINKIDHDVDPATPNIEEPFYYYSNPRSRLVTVPVIPADCATVEVPALLDFKNPPRITVTPDVCGTN